MSRNRKRNKEKSEKRKKKKEWKKKTRGRKIFLKKNHQKFDKQNQCKKEKEGVNLRVGM